MKKKHLSILIIILFLAVIVIIYYFTLPAPFIPFTNLAQSQVQENETPPSSPSTFPEQTEETPPTPQGGGGEGGEGESGEGEGGGGSESPSTQKINYTLNIDSFPSELTVLTNYSINDIILNIENVTPYSVKIESDTTACVLLTGVSVSGTIRWELDSEDCEPSLCIGFIGCSILMDNDHTAVVHYTPAT